mmetsp:Transcript_27699/g.26727  ORF Transcript_27699/g.26727 Transcript_27699/m.26727 type:complete len:97 (-) Transcript_27699:8-298(-)
MNLTYLLFMVISLVLGITGVIGLIRQTPFTNFVLSLYCVLYIGNVAAMMIFFSEDISFIKTYGEGINFIICLVLAVGIEILGNVKDSKKGKGAKAK